MLYKRAQCEQAVSHCSNFTSFIAVSKLKDRLWEVRHTLIWSRDCDSMLASVRSLLNRKQQNAAYLRKSLWVVEDRCAFGII